jgi:hypothetical protein
MLFRKAHSLLAVATCFIFLPWASACITLDPEAAEKLAAKKAEDDWLVFANARLAARDGKNLEVFQLWLLNNSSHVRGERSRYHDDLLSVLWVAASRLGMCPDRLEKDDRSASLWPISLHNYVIGAINQREPFSPTFFEGLDSFELGKQNRFVSYESIVSPVEIKNLRLRIGSCLARDRLLLLSENLRVKKGSEISQRRAEREKIARSLIHLLEIAKRQVNASKVRSFAVLDARLFDLRLFVATSERQRNLDSILFEQDSLDRLKAHALGWTEEEWASLKPQRQLVLYQKVSAEFPPEHRDRIVLAMLDKALERRDGNSAELWIALYLAKASRERRQVIWSNERGSRLLSLDAEAGFHERGVIGLHRGIDELERGAMRESLRSFGLALKHASESTQPEEVKRSVRRWVSHSLSVFQADAALVAVLKEVLPREDYNPVAQDLTWGAAFRSDVKSFRTLLGSFPNRGTSVTRLEKLEPLAKGNVSQFAAEFERDFFEEPSPTSKFLLAFLNALEREDRYLQQKLFPLVKMMRTSVENYAKKGEKGTASMRGNIKSALERMDAFVSGLDKKGFQTQDESIRALNPDKTLFAGSVKVLPGDEIPWPFEIRDIPMPNVFEPIEMIPQEWMANQEAEFGWSLRE